MNSDYKKWECEITAPPELHEPIQELFDAISWKLKHAESSSAQFTTDKNVGDTISRKMAIDALDGFRCGTKAAWKVIEDLPSAQPERDIPVKPIETTDKAWGIPARQAVCPKCDYYLGHVAFLGDYKGKRVTYCETCGQAIDWEGWNFDE